MKRVLIAIFLGVAFHAGAQFKAISYTMGDKKFTGFSAEPVKAMASKPGILILPAWKGIDAHSKEVAQKLASMGYFAFVADIYGEGNYPKDNAEAGEKSGYYKKNFTEYQQRIDLALNQLIQSGADPENIVAIGYCFGGTGVLEIARSGIPVRGVVSFHGGLAKDPARNNERIEAKVLVCHGADDPNVPEQDVLAFQDEMREGSADWQLIYYSGAVHAFTEKSAGGDNSKGAAYNEKADKRSWQHMQDFLREVLK